MAGYLSTLPMSFVCLGGNLSKRLPSLKVKNLIQFFSSDDSQGGTVGTNYLLNIHCFYEITVVLKIP